MAFAATAMPMRHHRSRFIRVSILACIFAITLGHDPASAQLQVPWLRGDLGLLAGTMPSPGITTIAGVAWNHADEVKDRNGNTIARGDLDTVVPLLGFAYTADKTLFGANLGGMIGISLANSALDLPELDVETGFGPGDLYIRPVTFGWHWSRADLTAGWGLFVPTGRFVVGGDENTGLGLWSTEYSLGGTVFFDRGRHWHLSTLAAYQSNSGKVGTLLRPGSTLTLYGGSGYGFKAGLANVGLVYYAQWKVSDDEIPLLPVELSRHRIFGVGPEVSYPIEKLPRPLIANARFFIEAGNESATEGFTMYLGITYIKPDAASRATRRR